MLKKIIKALLMNILKNHITTYKNGLREGLKAKGGLAFLQRFRHPTPEEEFLKGLDFNGQTIYDVGGYIGMLTIFFARSTGSAGKVITFEPNPDNCKWILENVRVNNFDNVIVKQIALGKQHETMTFAIRSSSTASGSAQEDIKNQILSEKGAKVLEIEVDSLDNQIAVNNLPKPDFVKIDVEGLEMDVLRGMEKTIISSKPKLFIEIHGADIQKKIENVQKVADFLLSHKYCVFHVESANYITSQNAHIAKQGHLYCT